MDEKERQSAKNHALNRLNRKECSSFEISKYLTQKKFAAEIVSDVVQELLDKEWIDDRRFSKILIRHYLAQSKGNTYIRQKLKQKGISMSLPEVDEVAREFRKVPEEETVVEIVRKKYPDAWGDPQEKRRALQALMRRGFSYSAIQNVLRTPPVSEDQDEALNTNEDL